MPKPTSEGSKPKRAARRSAAAPAATPAAAPREGSLLTDFDLHLFNEGSHFRLYEKLGAHPMTVQGREGTFFAVWAPDAERVSVIGDFNGWDKDSHLLAPRGESGVWEGFLPGVGPGALYKYHLVSRFNGYRADKADPFGFRQETPPRTGSVVARLEHAWNDAAWMRERRERQTLRAPMAIYEVHLGSWRRVPEEDDRPLTYRELAAALAEYVRHMGFTHVEFLPVMEHPFYGSWGYQTTGYFAPTSRYGGPEDFMFLIDTLHQNGIGVILDWVPSHFPTDEHGLGYFDGTHLFEHADPRRGFHPDWNSLIFNYGRNEVRSFLISSAFYWLDRFHVDGLRVDAVASMLYLDYSRREGEWIANEYGGRENIEAIAFLRRLNEALYGDFPDAQTMAEESTAWPMVSRPTYVGGLGFGMKWDMGWMHDTLSYFARDPIHRKFHHNDLTFRLVYAFTENFVLPLSHDEVVYGKGSLLGKMPGDDWQKFANLRLLFGYMYTQPGKKLLFMGGEIGQWSEWSHERSLDWHLLDYAPHQGIQRWVRDLNTFYRGEPCLHQADSDPAGFAWIDCNDSEQSALTYLRRGASPDEVLLVAANFTPMPRHNYRIGVPWGGYWEEILNSDAPLYGGGGQGNMGGLRAAPISWHGRMHALNVTLPPLGIVVFRGKR
jgi:1,4-alpha-glucan branching enzyme